MRAGYPALPSPVLTGFAVAPKARRRVRFQGFDLNPDVRDTPGGQRDLTERRDVSPSEPVVGRVGARTAAARRYRMASRMLLNEARPRSIPTLANRQATFLTDGDLVSPLVMYSLSHPRDVFTVQGQ